MDEATANAWMQASASVNQAAGTIAQANLNYNTRAWNDKWINQQREWAVQDRDYANEYNSPQAVMARAKAAGINPMYAATNGNVITASAPVRSVDNGSWHPQNPVQPSASGNDIMSIMNVKLMQAQLDNVKSQNANIQADTALKLANTQTAGLRQTGLAIDNKLKDILQSTTIGQEIAKYANLQEDIKTKEYGQTKLFEDINYRSYELQFLKDENYRRAAMTSSNIDVNVEKILQMRAQEMLAQSQTATGAYQREMYRQEYEKTQYAISNMRKDGRLKDWMLQYNQAKIDPGTEKAIDVVEGIIKYLMKDWTK